MKLGLRQCTVGLSTPTVASAPASPPSVNTANSNLSSPLTATYSLRPNVPSKDDAKPEGWLLPAAGGEARPAISHPAGVITKRACSKSPQTIRRAGQPRATKTLKPKKTAHGPQKTKRSPPFCTPDTRCVIGTMICPATAHSLFRATFLKSKILARRTHQI